MCKKSKILLLLAMVFIMTILLSTLIPVSDFDQDGYLDSLVTEGLLFIPMLYSAVGLISLLIRLPAVCLIVPELFSTLIVPPPIPTK